MEISVGMDSGGAYLIRWGEPGKMLAVEFGTEEAAVGHITELLADRPPEYVSTLIHRIRENDWFRPRFGPAERLSKSPRRLRGTRSAARNKCQVLPGSHLRKIRPRRKG
jgi:hypothetical protein